MAHLSNRLFSRSSVFLVRVFLKKTRNRKKAKKESNKKEGDSARTFRLLVVDTDQFLLRVFVARRIDMRVERERERERESWFHIIYFDVFSL